MSLFSGMANLLRKLFGRTEAEVPEQTEQEQIAARFQIEREILYIHTDEEID